MKKSLCILLIAALFLPAISLADSSQPTGVWVSCEGSHMMVFQLNPDKTATMTMVYSFASSDASISAIQGCWSMQGSTVNLSLKSGKIKMGSASISIDAQTIQLSYQNGVLVRISDGFKLIKVSD